MISVIFGWPGRRMGLIGRHDYPLQTQPWYTAWLLFSKNWTPLYGQFEEEATPQDVEAQTPKALEI